MTGAAATELILPALRGAYQRAVHSFSSSSVRARPVTGTHLFQIDGYKLVHRMVDGSSIKSRKFRVGGIDWQAAYHPHARGLCVGAGLHLAGTNNSGKNSTAMCQVSILDRAGVPAFSRLIEPRDFHGMIYPDRSSWSVDVHDFVKREELLKWAEDHVDDDRLRLRYDVLVLQMQSESPVQGYLKDFWERLKN
ncbi:BTB/POZ and MATH domain-containing protein 2-like [Aegilops tauschii subsp. strangulata]|uniref:BTB/POZ and MATH domain-containing protein 2-like n=1 Tax=Aegilops tauschii subsp. strangulata TaxID=200361 RepID=UPI00098AA8B7|nr:BTB/POZ and MATH domain-containing protein 2-like [Aegilops tauschii subsp. strangulata]